MKKLIIPFFVFAYATIFAQSGNVGINTTTPQARLEVQTEGNTEATNALRMQNATGNEVLLISDNGNVGIGKNSPEAALDILATVNGNDFLIQKTTSVTSFNGTVYIPNFRHLRYASAGSFNNGNPGGQIFLFDQGGTNASNVPSHGINIIPTNPALTRKGVYFAGDKTVGFSLDRLPTVDLDAGGSIKLRESTTPITAGSSCTRLTGVMQYYRGHFFGCHNNVWVQLDN